jgi:hypothetical protein
MSGAVHPDWLMHHLAVTGTFDDVARFRAAAAGSAHVPWRFDAEQIEEDTFLRLMEAAEARARHGIGAAGARRMAERLREAAQSRAERFASAGPTSPFDLHALLPIPPDILDLGAGHAVARQWLWENWGTRAPLRHVEDTGSDPEALRIRFWAADWTPWRAIVRLRASWEALHFDVRPVYAL